MTPYDAAEYGDAVADWEETQRHRGGWRKVIITKGDPSWRTRMCYRLRERGEDVPWRGREKTRMLRRWLTNDQVDRLNELVDWRVVVI